MLDMKQQETKIIICRKSTFFNIAHKYSFEIENKMKTEGNIALCKFPN